jgi:hypothetical protein
LNFIRPFCNEATDLSCFSHTVDKCGKHFHTPTLANFWSAMNNLFSRSHKSRSIWFKHRGKDSPSKSNTRWWSELECFKFLYTTINTLTHFLADEDHNVGANS